MTLKIAYAMQRGPGHPQQDAMLVAGSVVQAADAPVRALTIAGEFALVAIADGVSMSPFPSLASSYALEALAAISRQREHLLDGRDVREVHHRLCARLADHRRTRGAATTISLAHIRGSFVRVLNVGDSRVWLRSADGDVRQLSHDHTVLQGCIDRGEVEAGVEYASFYSGLEHALVADSEADNFAIHSVTLELASGDELLLCTDGVEASVGHARLRELMERSCGPVKRLGDLRDAISKRGAVDDCSIVALRFN